MKNDITLFLKDIVVCVFSCYFSRNYICSNKNYTDYAINNEKDCNKEVVNYTKCIENRNIDDENLKEIKEQSLLIMKMSKDLLEERIKLLEMIKPHLDEDDDNYRDDDNYDIPF